MRACKLNPDGRENGLEISPVLEVPGAEEGGTESPVCKRPFCDRLSDCHLPRSRESVQPVDGLLSKVMCPQFYLVQNCPAGSLETTVAISMSILGLVCIAKIVEDSRFS
jgi:hypothetical protein